MAITKEDIKNLASLARIDIEDLEAEGLTSQIDAILGYVSQVEGIKISETKDVANLRNVMREDKVTHEDSEYTEDMLSNAPARDGNYLEVKKIL